MVEDRAIERVGRGGEAAGDLAIAVARPRVAARVVMGEDDPGAAVLSGVGDDFAEREIGAVRIAFVTSQVEAARLAVDMGNPQAFAKRIPVGQAAGEEGPRGGETVED